MADLLLANNAFSTLAGGINNSAVSLTVQSGDGAKFPSPTGTQYMRLTLRNVAGAVEIVYANARSSDTISGLLRGQEGTSALSWLIGDKVQLCLTNQDLIDLSAQPNYVAPDSLAQATAPTLTSVSPSIQILTPVAPITLTLPTTSVRRATFFRIINRGTLANSVTVKASDGSLVLVIPGGFSSEVVSLQATPISNAHWALPSNFISGGSLSNPLLNSSLIAGALPFSTVLDLFGLVPVVVASAGGAGNQITNSGGNLNFNFTAHGFREGDVVDLQTSSSLPGGTALATPYYVHVIDANNFQLSASATFTPVATGLPSWVPGAVLAWVNAGVGNQTLTPGFVPAPNQTIADIDLIAGGGGGGGSSTNTQTATSGQIGGDSTISVLAWTAKGGALGVGALAATEAAGGIATAAANGTVTSGRVFKGQDGQDGTRGNGQGCHGGTPGRTAFSPWGDGGKGATCPDNGAANGYSGGAGASGQRCNGRPPVVPGTFYRVTIGAGGAFGAAGNAGNAGNPGIAGGAQIRM